MSKDRDYIQLINCAKWQRLRKAILTMHPLCSRCESRGYIKSATEIHHRVPVESATSRAEKERLMYDPDNLRPLCHQCHVEVHRELFKARRHTSKERTQTIVSEFKNKFFGE